MDVTDTNLVVTLAAPSSTTHDPTTPASSTTPLGALTLYRPSGAPYGFLNAESLTAFRTALASTLLLVRRNHLKTITCFGAGAQAFWHIRLSLLLRGTSIRHIHILNRSFDRSRELVKKLHTIPYAVKESEGWANTKFSIVTEGYGEYQRLLKEQVRAADVLFFTTPSTEPLFPHEYLTATEGRKKGRLLVAIGSYKPHMIEIPPEVLRQAVKTDHGRHHHRHAQEGGVVVVDTLIGCLREAGEVVQADIRSTETVELGELVMLEAERWNEMRDALEQVALERKALQREESGSTTGSASSGPNSPDTDRYSRRGSATGGHSGSETTTRMSLESIGRGSSWFSKSPKSERRKSHTEDGIKDDGLARWLADGNVVYKSVGMGLMDLVVGGELVRLARSKGVGQTIEGF